MSNEADTCRRCVVPNLRAAGWEEERHRINEQVTFTEGHVAFKAALRTRREGARRVRSERKEFWDQYSPEARAILDELLEEYALPGTAQFVIPHTLEVPPISEHGNVVEIAAKFGREEKLIDALQRLQTLLYAA